MGDMLRGKVALVTGAAGGIGSHAARLFAAEGAVVVASDVDQAGAEAAARAARETGGEAIAIAADLARPEEVDALVRNAVEACGRVDCAFNNAGVSGGQVGQGGRFTADWEDAAFEATLGVNVLGTWRCMRAEIRQMQAQGGGAIVNAASIAGLSGFLATAGYAASKHAVVGMTRTAALEYAPIIRVNALCPGYVDTGMLTDTMSRRRDQILARIPFGRLGDPMEVAEMACWLLSDRASYATGATFTVDGGHMAG